MVKITLNIEDSKDGSTTKLWVSEVKKKESRIEGMYAHAANECMKAHVIPLLEAYCKALLEVTKNSALYKHQPRA